MKTLILRQKRDDYFLKYINYNDICNIYKIDSKNIFFKIYFKFSLSLLSFYYADWKKKIKSYDKVIIFDTMYNKSLISYIKKRNPSCVIYLYFWNKIVDYHKKMFLNKNIDYYYTFNIEDSISYRISFNPQFYSLQVPLKETCQKYDIIFLGFAKNREDYILDLQSNFQKYSLVCNFNIIKNLQDFISYEDYLEQVYASNCILDIGCDSKAGLTLRSLEALFLKKKLITNYKNIVKYDFYNKNNIFIIGVDNLADIVKFLKDPLIEIDKDIIIKYDFYSWLERFNND